MTRRRLLAASVLITAALAGTARAQSTDKGRAAIDKGLAFLKSQQQPDGGFATADQPPAITALVVKAFAQAPGTVDQATVDKGYAALVALQKPTGGIYRDTLANYNTAIIASALAAAPGDTYRPQVDKAVAFLRTLQWTDQPTTAADTERKPVPPTDPRYGGVGYGNVKQHPTGRPDGSNLQFTLDALHDAGVKSDDPAYKAALAFTSRLQNRSESNDQAWAGNDGGFIYTDAENGQSNGGESVGPDGKKRLASYGTMTYAGMKSMLYAGLGHDDPRVKAAFGWVTRHWTWDEVPGLVRTPPATATSGLFYYFHTATRALAAYGEPVVTDAQGNAHDWRAEVTDKLASIQHPNGSWVGEPRWMENNPTLVTALAVLALEQAQADLKVHPAK